MSSFSLFGARWTTAKTTNVTVRSGRPHRCVTVQNLVSQSVSFYVAVPPRSPHSKDGSAPLGTEPCAPYVRRFKNTGGSKGGGAGTHVTDTRITWVTQTTSEPNRLTDARAHQAAHHTPHGGRLKRGQTCKEPSNKPAQQCSTGARRGTSLRRSTSWVSNLTIGCECATCLV